LADLKMLHRLHSDSSAAWSRCSKAKGALDVSELYRLCNFGGVVDRICRGPLNGRKQAADYNRKARPANFATKY
jgi:hypothetical protein